MSTGQTQIYHELDMPKFTMPTVLISLDPQYLFFILFLCHSLQEFKSLLLWLTETISLKASG